MRKFKMKSEKCKIKIRSLKFLILNFIFALLIFNFALIFAQDKIVAIVNNDVITQKDLSDFINFMRVQLSEGYAGTKLEEKLDSMKADLLERLIEDRLILQQAKKNNVKVEESRIKSKIDELRKRYSTDTEFQDALSQQGLVLADVQSKIEEQLLMYNMIEAKIKNRITVNPLEVTDFYQKNAEEFKLPEERSFELIASEDEGPIKEAYNDLKNGLDFSESAKKYSLSVSKLNTAKDGQLRKEIQDLAFKLKIDEITQPIKIEERYYIFKLDRIIPPKQQTLTEARDRIYAFLFDKKMQEELAKWLDDLKKNSYIKISNG